MCPGCSICWFFEPIWENERPSIWGVDLKLSLSKAMQLYGVQGMRMQNHNAWKMNISYWQKITRKVSMAAANESIIRIYFESKSLTVEAEEQAYSFDSLVSDLGGVLGLFLGFNFLMLWELLKCLQIKWKSFSLNFWKWIKWKFN